MRLMKSPRCGKNKSHSRAMPDKARLSRIRNKKIPGKPGIFEPQADAKKSVEPFAPDIAGQLG